ncbi:hypothetical protein HF325_004749 [Metschnikowia pulcherrima]|uniref:Uncharacterized protein n=1 Tax=Metschnikowia pulcherrima TaxID=27326 RepID=A0A8H7LB08_9ASCO|nr:hypothetical protein HF325_004749 [Metschnikowia pulcherrima]
MAYSPDSPYRQKSTYTATLRGTNSTKYTSTYSRSRVWPFPVSLSSTDDPPLAATPSSSDSFSAYMGQSVLRSRSADASQLTPQTSTGLGPSKKHATSFPSIVHVLDTNEKAPKWPSNGEDSRQMCFSPTDRGGLFLLPVLSHESQLSKASSVTENYTLRDPLVNVTACENFSPLLLLPIEILYQIIETVYYDESTNSILANLERFLKTIPVLLKPFNQLAIRFLYKYAIFNRPNSFERFLLNIVNQPDIGHYVEFMDFQTFTSIGLGRTGRMNQEIQMVTASTILMALELCPNLIEFQASENIQDDMDTAVLLRLFNNMPKIQALDFCGASLKQFAAAFDELTIDAEMVDADSALVQSATPLSLKHLFKISFHDCSNLPLRVFEKLLPHFGHLRRLDLTHTMITSSALLASLPHTCRLTHLSLARCLKLTTKDLIQFLTKHSSVANDSLQWLNLQTDSNVVSPLTDQYLLFVLNNLKAADLRYLNLGGLPVNKQVLHTIKTKFPNLESLAISHATIEYQDLLHLLQDNTSIKFLDLTNCKGMDRRALLSMLRRSFASGLEAIEFDYKTLYDLTGGEHFTVQPLQTDFSINSTTHLPQVWKFYDNEGRRAWIYKIATSDPSYNALVSGRSGLSNQMSNMVYYDLETGAKIETKLTKPKFLIYASRKINCSIGYYNLNKTKKKKYFTGEILELVWPVEFSQRGIYNYYSLNVK